MQNVLLTIVSARSKDEIDSNRSNNKNEKGVPKGAQELINLQKNPLISVNNPNFNAEALTTTDRNRYLETHTINRNGMNIF